MALQPQAHPAQIKDSVMSTPSISSAVMRVLMIGAMERRRLHDRGLLALELV